MGKPRATFISDILVEHYEELEFLWGQRLKAIESPVYTLRELVHLEERIQAHVQGVLVVGERFIPYVVQGLSAEATSAAFAAAYPLLRLNQSESIKLVIDAFLDAEGPRLEGLRQALCHGPVSPILQPLRRAAGSSVPHVSLAALGVLCCQSHSDLDRDRLDRFLRDENPALRRESWRVVARLKVPLATLRYKRGMEDDEDQVRSQVIWAGAWGRQTWLLDRCRALANSPEPERLDALRLLAILGSPADLNTIRDPGWVERIGPSWFDVLGSCGHPAVIVDLIRGMENPNPRLAVAAGSAFTRMTGRQVESKARVQLPPEDGHEPDSFEKEFLDEAFLPDPESARVFWKKNKSSYAQGLRWCRGREVSHEVSLQTLNQLDLQSRGEALLRARFVENWGVGLVDLERFPQRCFDPTSPARHLGLAGQQREPRSRQVVRRTVNRTG
jgi:uncharacterized protein (TIGR02270 family)